MWWAAEARARSRPAACCARTAPRSRPLAKRGAVLGAPLGGGSMWQHPRDAERFAVPRPGPLAARRSAAGPRMLQPAMPGNDRGGGWGYRPMRVYRVSVL